MSYIWADGDYTIPLANGSKRWLRPFPDDFSNIVFEQDYQQFADDFVPLPLDTPHDEIPDAFLVQESQPEPMGAIVQWTRTYSKIPPSRTIAESYAWSVPGIGTEAVYSPVNISSVSHSGSANLTGSGSVTTITCATSPGVNVGDSVLISYTFTDSVTGSQYGRDVLRTALSGTSGTSVRVALISEPGGTMSFQTLRKVEPGRDPYVEEVWSRIQYDYYLPGVSAGIMLPEHIPTIEALDIYDNTGRRTTSFTADTTPSLATWRAQVASGALVCAVQSIPRRWMGNIYERATRYVRAK